MDYRHDIRFTIARFINRLFFLLPLSKSIAMQYALTRRLLPNPTTAVIVPTKDKILLKLDTHADAGTQLQGSIDRNLYYLGTYELATTEMIRRFLRRDGVCIDVGSHTGSIALFASKIAAEGKILAYEPVSILQKRLRENISLNHVQNIKPIQVALGAEEGKLDISVNHNNRGSSSLQPNKSEVYAKKEQVKVDTLDHQVSSEKLARVDMIKIDVEGFEASVLRGAKTTIQKYRPVLIVEHDPKNTNVRGAFDFISKLGLYTVFIPKNGRHIRGPLVRVNAYDELPQNYVTNFICLPS